ncbi:MAG: hypothetical protein HRT88_00050 [Lentisphaeraceae bacterium]|nr:hypothetical protein [Lentisphaeraceae bacterium]
MSRQLQRFESERILKIIDRWSGKLTWWLLCQKIETDLEFLITRQTLNNHKNILSAYRRKKQVLKEAPDKTFCTDSVLYNENMVLKAKVERLKKDIDQLIEFQLTMMANINGGAELIRQECLFGQEE